MQWDEMALDVIALVLIAAGVWLLYPPAGLIVAGIGVAWLSIGLHARRKKQRQPEDGRTYRAVEIDGP